MKTLKFLLAGVIALAAFAGCDKDEFLTVENTAGNLESQIGNLKNVSSLKISGPLNGDDIVCLREILLPYPCKVSTLDLSEASIVEGGMSYYQVSSTNYYTSNDEIGDYMFEGCNFKTIMLPNTVVSIGNNAFSFCSYLVRVTMGNRVISIDSRAFGGCGRLLEINIPNSVTSIGAIVFADCTSLKEITIPDSVTSLGERAFAACTSLNSVTIGNGVKSIEYGTFGGCTNLTNVVIGKNVESIGDSAFSGCTGLMEITLPGSITEIGDSTFSYCSSLTEIAIPDSVTSIGTRAFYGCTNLYTLIIGGGVITIGDYAFDGNDRLYEIYCYASTPPNIGSETFTKQNTFLYVPKGSLEAYETAWGDYFTNISEM